MAQTRTRIEPHVWEEPPAVKSLVYDSHAGRVGEIQAREARGLGDRYWLRPPGGGREWSTEIENLYPADQAEELSAKVAAANNRSRWESWGD